MKKNITIFILLLIAIILLNYRGEIFPVLEKIERKISLPKPTTIEDVRENVLKTETKNGNQLKHKQEEQITDNLEAILDYSEETPVRIINEDEDIFLTLPKEINLAVPFTSQAPFEDWSMPYKEACEEASVIMVNAFLKNIKLTKNDVKEEILKLVEWQKDNFGHWEDTDVEETAHILREYYGYKNIRVVYDISIDDIKREIAQGRPVILPAAGRLLGNKYFRQPGPLYHMLVARGWTKDGKIITNDPGTKRGESYLYEPETLINAIRDWNNGDVYNGIKAMIIVEPN